MGEPEDRLGSAERLLSRGQIASGGLLVALALADGLFFGPLVLLQTIVAVITGFYVIFLGLKIMLWWAAEKADLLPHRIASADDPRLPKYTILVPLYKEANVIRPLVQALSSIRYPMSRIEVFLLLEPDDRETARAIGQIALPENFAVLVAPDAGPQTKPKACNYGYQHASGDILVIFDAEDRPDPDQLLRAVESFRVTGRRDPRVGCLQARLAFWNPRESWISSYYWAEYVVHFETVLTGLARLRLIPPLGGTSNHFLMKALDAVAQANGPWEFTDADGGCTTVWGPWDPYNVTEDADLAFRLATVGYSIGMLNSVTYEEAPDSARKAKNQRSRWLQGYAQTGLVHSRAPLRSMRRVGVLRYLTFILLMLGTPVSLLLNPIVWVTTLVYIGARLSGVESVAAFIQSVLPAPVYYSAMAAAVGGNTALFFQKLLSPIRRQWESENNLGRSDVHALAEYLKAQEYGLTARLLLAPLWWAFTSVSAYRALRKLLIRSQRSHWDKTPHGHALATEAAMMGHEDNGQRESLRRVLR